jgi:predicted nucleic acid-binding protein
LRRPPIRKLHRLSDGRIRRVISEFYKVATVIRLPAEIPATVPQDPKDDPIVMTAIAGKADALCTLDRHLHEAAMLALCRGHGIRVLRDTELWAELRTGN